MEKVNIYFYKNNFLFIVKSFIERNQKRRNENKENFSKKNKNAEIRHEKNIIEVNKENEKM